MSMCGYWFLGAGVWSVFVFACLCICADGLVGRVVFAYLRISGFWNGRIRIVGCYRNRVCGFL